SLSDRTKRERGIEFPPLQHRLPFFRCKFGRCHFPDQAGQGDGFFAAAHLKVSRAAVDVPAFAQQQESESCGKELLVPAAGDELRQFLQREIFEGIRLWPAELSPLRDDDEQTNLGPQYRPRLFQRVVRFRLKQARLELLRIVEQRNGGRRI